MCKWRACLLPLPPPPPDPPPHRPGIRSLQSLAAAGLSEQAGSAPDPRRASLPQTGVPAAAHQGFGRSRQAVRDARPGRPARRLARQEGGGGRRACAPHYERAQPPRLGMWQVRPRGEQVGLRTSRPPPTPTSPPAPLGPAPRDSASEPRLAVPDAQIALWRTPERGLRGSLGPGRGIPSAARCARKAPDPDARQVRRRPERDERLLQVFVPLRRLARLPQGAAGGAVATTRIPRRAAAVSRRRGWPPLTWRRRRRRLRPCMAGVYAQQLRHSCGLAARGDARVRLWRGPVGNCPSTES